MSKRHEARNAVGRECFVDGFNSFHGTNRNRKMVFGDPVSETRDGKREFATTEEANWDKFLRKGILAVQQEHRDLKMGQDSKGGFLIAPEQFSNALIKEVDNQTYALSICHVEKLKGAHDLGVPVLESDPADAELDGMPCLEQAFVRSKLA